MDDLDPPETFTAFSGPKRLAHGSWPEVSSAAQQAARAGLSHIVVLSDLSGETRDFEAGHASPPQKPARGRPKLGVTAREVTLLPRLMLKMLRNKLRTSSRKCIFYTLLLV